MITLRILDIANYFTRPLGDKSPYFTGNVGERKLKTNVWLNADEPTTITNPVIVQTLTNGTVTFSRTHQAPAPMVIPGAGSTELWVTHNAFTGFLHLPCEPDNGDWTLKVELFDGTEPVQSKTHLVRVDSTDFYLRDEDPDAVIPTVDPNSDPVALAKALLIKDQAELVEVNRTLFEKSERKMKLEERIGKLGLIAGCIILLMTSVGCMKSSLSMLVKEAAKDPAHVVIDAAGYGVIIHYERQFPTNWIGPINKTSK
jgi:hypothetical protein